MGSAVCLVFCLGGDNIIRWHENRFKLYDYTLKNHAGVTPLLFHEGIECVGLGVHAVNDPFRP